MKTNSKQHATARADLYQALFAAGDRAALVVDPFRDRIVAANPAACDLLGSTAPTLERSAMSALHPGQLPALIVFSEQALAQGFAWSNGFRPRRPDGSEPALEYSAAPLEHDGRLLLAITLSDPEARRQRELEADAHRHLRSGLGEWQRVERVFQEIERENQLILGAAGEGIYGVNAEGITTFVNPAAERLLGWRAEEMVGRDMHPMVHHTRPDGSAYPHVECPIYAAFRDGEVHHVDDEMFWRKDGVPIWVEYTSTPIRDQGELVGAVIVFRDVTARREAEVQLRAALEEVNRLRERLELENAYLQETLRIEYSHRFIIGHSRAMQNVLQQIELVAPTGANVLITGESGTGKELIARAVHDASDRRDRPLIRVNCAAIPRELFESEFFGHVKGAFTGALQDRVGRFELADGGTLFLDEVGEIPLELQGKLLRVLQEQQFERVGEAATRQVDVRIIAATNRDLQQAVKTGSFREDLFFRLNVFPLESVPLRERVEDIPLLAAHFLRTACQRLKITELTLTQGDVRQLCGYHWPGNVRELENVVERAAILAREGRLRFELPESGRPPASQPRAEEESGTILTEGECRERDRRNLIAALEACDGRVFGPGGAAQLLGVKPTTLASRIKALKIALRSGISPR